MLRQHRPRKSEPTLHYTAVFEPSDEGGYTVSVPALPGCISEGDTFEEAKEHIEEAVQAYLMSLRKHGEPVPVEDEQPFVGRVSVRAK